MFLRAPVLCWGVDVPRYPISRRTGQFSALNIWPIRAALLISPREITACWPLHTCVWFRIEVECNLNSNWASAFQSTFEPHQSPLCQSKPSQWLIREKHASRCWSCVLSRIHHWHMRAGWTLELASFLSAIHFNILRSNCIMQSSSALQERWQSCTCLHKDCFYI